MSARLLVLLAVAALELGCAGGYSRADARAASAVAIASNAALPVVVGEYRRAGLDVVREASSAEEAYGRWAAVRARWTPVWRAWEAYRVAFGVWSDALTQNQPDAASAAVDGMRAAFCRWRATLAPPLRAELAAVPAVAPVLPRCEP